jgi:hypothetical protein
VPEQHITEQKTAAVATAPDVRNIVRAAYYKTEGSCRFQLQKFLLLEQLTTKRKAAAGSSSRSKKKYRSSLLPSRRQLQVPAPEVLIARAANYQTEGSCRFQLKK